MRSLRDVGDTPDENLGRGHPMRVSPQDYLKIGVRKEGFDTRNGPLLCITRFASDDHITLDAFSTLGDGNFVIHGDIFWLQ